MLKKIIFFIFCFGLSANCFASSSEAWEEFQNEVKASCEKAARNIIKDYEITVDPFGSESYGMAILRGKTSGGSTIFHICVYDKETKKAELGSEITESDKNAPAASGSLPKGPKLDEVKGLNGINTSVRYPIQDHEKYLPGFTASLERGTREGETYDYMLFNKDGKAVAEIIGENGKVSAIIVRNTMVIPLVEGRIGDKLQSFIWGGDEKTYGQYCVPGMEEWAGKIICKTRDASRSETKHIRHVFSGDYSGPDGELPPLDAAKAFTIEATIWEK